MTEIDSFVIDGSILIGPCRTILPGLRPCGIDIVEVDSGKTGVSLKSVVRLLSRSRLIFKKFCVCVTRAPAPER